MLLELEVENFALLNRVHLEFAPGFNVLTGETGAGKSILLDALGFLLGGMTREATPQQRVSGRFLASPAGLALLAEWGYEESEELLLSRDISAGGRSSCRINSRLASLANLKELGACLVEIHGQHQSTSLQRPSKHLELLDRMAEHSNLLEDYRRVFRRGREIAEALDELSRAERDRLRELEWLRHELAEIDEAGVRVDEEENLEAGVRRLAAGEELARKVSQALEGLHSDGGAVDRVSEASRLVSSLVRHDAQLEPIAGRLQEAEILISEVAHELTSYRDNLSQDPQLLDDMQSRLEQLKALKRKYGADLAEVLAYAERGRQRLEELQTAQERGQKLETELAATRAERDRLARELSKGRQRAAGQLVERVHQELAALSLSAMRFSVELQPCEPGPSGADQGEFYLAANPGLPPAPLARVASGGELSRIMLALISLFAAYDPVPTLIFDEIDAGLGGRAAEAVARRLGMLAADRQVLCVTHLAVIAATGAQHVRVSKEVEDGATQVRLEVLDERERELEVARMLSGDATPETALQHARELLKR